MMDKTGPRTTFHRAVVTGATSGIGLELSRLLAQHQTPLLLVARSQESLKQVAQELHSAVPVETLAVDLTLPLEREKLVAYIHQHSPDLIINNAGFGLYGEALEYSSKKHLDLIELNVSSLLELTLEAVRTWRTQEMKGVVINISSAADELPFPLLSTYAASKAFVTRFSESFDYECIPYGIRILAACPGVVQTNFRQRAGGAAESTTAGAGRPMSALFAANEIWKQLQAGTQTHYFDGRYRFLRRLAMLIPRRWVAAINRHAIEQFHPISPFLKIPVKES